MALEVKFKLVSVLLTLIASAIDVGPASLIPLLDQSKKVSILLTLIASTMDRAPASLSQNFSLALLRIPHTLVQ